MATINRNQLFDFCKIRDIQIRTTSFRETLSLNTIACKSPRSIFPSGRHIRKLIPAKGRLTVGRGWNRHVDRYPFSHDIHVQP
jgi:hypothetical protein